MIWQVLSQDLTEGAEENHEPPISIIIRYLSNAMQKYSSCCLTHK